MNLRVLTFDSSNPYFNLAFEEALARARSCDLIPDTMRIWRNPRAIILGYFRRIEDDINTSVATRMKLPIIRRFTGGGTVYHDMGCINYSLAIKRKVKFPISYLYGDLLRGTLEALKHLGLSSYLVNINDVVIDNRKVSGTAASIRWGVLFLHGSILVDADLKTLNLVLKLPSDIKPSIDPVKYRVVNLKEYLKFVTYNDVLGALVKGYSKVLSSDPYIDEPSKDEIKLAEILYHEKYTKDEWNVRLHPREIALIEKDIEEKYLP